jgi:PAS domain S-box-containing protein
MSISLINEAREFAVEELFFSTTDHKGHIQRANRVFERISGYSWEELDNKPHNVIRHPDMPRIVFRIFWDYIQAGRPVVAYVKNLAHDGRYYWVAALVTPVPQGYLSVRFKPTSPLFAEVEKLYAELREIEARVESIANDRKAAMAESQAVLDANLHALGFAGYEEFMHHVLKVEMRSREGFLPEIAGRAAANRSAVPGSPRTAAEMFDRLADVLNDLFGDLELYNAINKGVREKSANVADLSEALRVSALNGAIEADRLGARAAGMRPVLDSLRVLSSEITRKGPAFRRLWAS